MSYPTTPCTSRHATQQSGLVVSMATFAAGGFGAGSSVIGVGMQSFSFGAITPTGELLRIARLDEKIREIDLGIDLSNLPVDEPDSRGGRYRLRTAVPGED